jgi:hypothetical protein
MNNRSFKMKKNVSFVLALLVVAGAVFAQAPTLDKLSIVITDGRGIVRPANDQISGGVVFPDTYEGSPVTQVSSFIAPRVTSIHVGNNMELIGTGAFNRCTSLTSIIFGSKVINISTNSFRDCTSLISVTFLGRPPTGNGISPSAFPGDLRAKAQAGGAGTYTRQRGGEVWTKVGGTVTCPTCGGTGVIHQ